MATTESSVRLFSVLQIFDALSDEHSVRLFYRIVHNGDLRRNVAIEQLKITPKQYYSKLSALKNSGIVEKKNGRYLPTSLGWVVHEAMQQIEFGVNYYWKLKAIDSMRPEFSERERTKIIGQLIDKQDMREFLIRKLKEVELRKK
jgi:hypothetical protein